MPEQDKPEGRPTGFRKFGAPVPSRQAPSQDDDTEETEAPSDEPVGSSVPTGD
jgi:hypothetical protein